VLPRVLQGPQRAPPGEGSRSETCLGVLVGVPGRPMVRASDPVRRIKPRPASRVIGLRSAGAGCLRRSVCVLRDGPLGRRGV